MASQLVPCPLPVNCDASAVKKASLEHPAMAGKSHGAGAVIWLDPAA